MTISRPFLVNLPRATAARPEIVAGDPKFQLPQLDLSVLAITRPALRFLSPSRSPHARSLSLSQYESETRERTRREMERSSSTKATEQARSRQGFKTAIPVSDKTLLLWNRSDISDRKNNITVCLLLGPTKVPASLASKILFYLVSK